MLFGLFGLAEIDEEMTAWTSGRRGKGSQCWKTTPEVRGQEDEPAWDTANYPGGYAQPAARTRRRASLHRWHPTYTRKHPTHFIYLSQRLRTTWIEGCYESKEHFQDVKFVDVETSWTVGQTRGNILGSFLLKGQFTPQSKIHFPSYLLCCSTIDSLLFVSEF